MVPAPPAQIYLLTHVHTDHLQGLTSDFTGRILCSPDTKRMLLRLENEVDRSHLSKGYREVGRRKFAGLKAKVVDRGGKMVRIVDRIEAIPYGHPKEVELGYEDGKPVKVTITLLDANHCPGSTMFLIQTPTKAVLHTGDIRCDNLFMQSLRRNPAVQQFIEPYFGFSAPAEPVKRENESKRVQLDGLTFGGRRTLDRIYLDTGAILGTGDMPDREPVLQDLLQQISLYPADTIFFLNIWCFGWESIITEIARTFNTPIHVDRYKRSIYSAIHSDPFLMACTTTDHTLTRFHACDRYDKCDSCKVFDETSRQADGRWERTCNVDKRIVQVNMVEIKSAAWDVEHRSFLAKLAKAALGEGDWPFAINCPIARHSPLPELQNLVKLFRPKAISPNTIQHPQALDYYLLPGFFRDCMDEGGYLATLAERDRWLVNKFGVGFERMFGGGLEGAIGTELGELSNSGKGCEGIGVKLEAAGEYGQQRLGAGRSAHLQDQRSRLVSFDKLLPATNHASLTSTTQPWASITGGGLSTIPSVSQLQNPGAGFGIPSGSRIVESRGFLDLDTATYAETTDYETDDDESPKKRRRFWSVPPPLLAVTKTSTSNCSSATSAKTQQGCLPSGDRSSHPHKGPLGEKGNMGKVDIGVCMPTTIKAKESIETSSEYPTMAMDIKSESETDPRIDGGSITSAKSKSITVSEKEKEAGAAKNHGVKPKIKTERHPRPRFRVDQEHLRALAMVAVDEAE